MKPKNSFMQTKPVFSLQYLWLIPFKMQLFRLLLGSVSESVQPSLSISVPVIRKKPTEPLLLSVRYVLFYFISSYTKKRTFAVHIQPRHLIWDKQIIIQIYSVGIPSSIMMLLPSVLISMLNRILSLFDADTELMKAGITALRIISLGFLISTIGVIYSGVFEARGNGRNSLLFSLLRQFAVTLPVSFILTAFLGPAGVWISFPIGEFTASAAAFLLKYYKKGTFHPFQDKKVPFVHAIQIHNLRNTDVQVLHLLRLLPLS